MLWVYSFWHTYGLVHETLPMAALVALTVVLTGCTLLGQLRLSACGWVRAFRTGRPLYEDDYFSQRIGSRFLFPEAGEE